MVEEEAYGVGGEYGVAKMPLTNSLQDPNHPLYIPLPRRRKEAEGGTAGYPRATEENAVSPKGLPTPDAKSSSSAKTVSEDSPSSPERGDPASGSGTGSMGAIEAELDGSGPPKSFKRGIDERKLRQRRSGAEHVVRKEGSTPKSKGKKKESQKGPRPAKGEGLSLRTARSASAALGDERLAIMDGDGPRSAPPLPLRRSARHDAQRRMSSGYAGASHFSKAIPIPEGKGDVRIEAVGRERDGVSSIAQDELRSPGLKSPGGNAKFKKQITKITKPFTSPVAGRRRRKRFKDGEVVFKGHRNWEIVLSIQFGLRHTSELLQATQSQEPDEADFRESLVFDFNPVEEHRSAVNTYAKWEHPAPFIYRLIRERFGVDEDDFLDATCSESRVRELPTPGRSGALFYITDDENYFMKTLTSHEEKMLSTILPDYYTYVSSNPDTMLNRFLAHFSLRTTRGRHIRMVVMASIFNDQLFIDRKYDLKGSTKNRQATAKELACDNVTYKDLDLQAPIFFSPKVVDRIISQLERDSAFLERHRVMDYSLLLGMNEMIAEESSLYEASDSLSDEERPYFIGHHFDRQDGKKKGYRICMGIIDTLQGFRLRKKIEYAGKVVQYCSTNYVSVAPPSMYRNRFIDLLKTKFLPDPNFSIEQFRPLKPMSPTGLASPTRRSRRPR